MIDTFFEVLRKMMFTFVFLVFGFVAAYAPVIHVDEHNNHAQISNVEMAYAAGGGPWDLPNFIENTVSAVQTTIQVVWDNWIYIKESVLDGISWGVAKQFISTLVGDLVNWINTGTNGGPAFVQNLKDYLLQQADKVAGQYINQLGSATSFVCDPFKLDVQLAVAEQADFILSQSSTQLGQPTPRSCTITNTIPNFDAFLAGDFHQGGWDGWLEMINNPEVNTPYGAILNARTGLTARVLESNAEETKLLDFGNGFISTELCRIINGPGGSTEQCSITTPGKIITEQLNKSLGIGLDQLVAADEFDEIVLALVGQLANQAISGVNGLLGLSGGNANSYTGYNRGSFVSDLVNSGTISGTTGQANTNNITGAPLNTNAGIQSANNQLVNAIAGLQTIGSQIDTYIANLTSFVNNPLNSPADIQIAQVSLVEARNLRAKISSDISAAQPIVTQYTNLANQFPTATPQQQITIQQQQSDLVQQFNAIGVTTTQGFGVYTSQWDLILSRNVGPVISPCSQNGQLLPGCNLGGLVPLP